MHAVGGGAGGGAAVKPVETVPPSPQTVSSEAALSLSIITMSYTLIIFGKIFIGCLQNL